MYQLHKQRITHVLRWIIISLFNRHTPYKVLYKMYYIELLIYYMNTKKKFTNVTWKLREKFLIDPSKEIKIVLLFNYNKLLI